MEKQVCEDDMKGVWIAMTIPGSLLGKQFLRKLS